MLARLALIASLAGCPCPSPAPTPTPTPVLKGTQVTLLAESPLSTTLSSAIPVYVSFGADSKIVAADWASFCTVTAPLACNFWLTGSKLLPNPDGKYLNITIAFNAAVGCGSTKSEVNVNNPAWYDILDVSLVDGYSNRVVIDYKAPDGSKSRLGPPYGPEGNEKVFGLYPYGCDLCTSNSAGTCGIPPGTSGCKAGTQFKPDVPCQFQGAVKGGGGSVDVILLER